jgi:hypothetical protein
MQSVFKISALVLTDVSEEHIASVISAKRTIELETALAVSISSLSALLLLVTANLFPGSLIISTVMMEAIRSSVTSVLKRATGHHFTEAVLKNQYLLENV